MAEPSLATVQLEELLDEDGTLELAVLERAARHELVAVGRFTDEELCWLGGGEVEDDPLESPRLGSLPAEAQQAALDAALCLLLARGDLVTVPGPDGEDDRVVPTGRHAVLEALREAPLGVLRLTVEHRHLGVRHAAAYHVTDGTFLLEEVDPMGLHTCTVANLEVAASWVRRQLDPDDAVTSAHTTGPLADPTPAPRAAPPQRRPTSACDVQLARAEGEEVLTGAVRVVTFDDGGTLAQGWSGDGDDLRERELDGDGVSALAVALLVDGIRPRVRDHP